MKQWLNRVRGRLTVLLVTPWLVISAEGVVASESLPKPGDLRLDLRTDVGWEMEHFLYSGADFSEALLSHVGQTVDLSILTHETVPHRCMFDFSPDYCDDRGRPDSWGRAIDPVVCTGITAASRARLSGQNANANQLCITFRGGFSYPQPGADKAPDLVSHYRARIGQPEREGGTESVALTVTLTLEQERSLHRLSPGCYGPVCIGDTLSSVQATTQVPLEILPGKEACGRMRSEQWPAGLTAQFRNSRIARLDVTPPSNIRTDSGVGLGESPPLYELYQGELDETLEAGPGSLPIQAVYWQARGEKGLRFMFDSALKITAMAAGGKSLTGDWPCR